MANESEPTQTPVAAPIPAPAAAATPAPAATAEAKPAPANKPPLGRGNDKRKPSRNDRGDRGPKQRVPALDSDFQVHQKNAPNVRDLWYGVGYSVDAVSYFRSKKRAPCGMAIRQRMQIDCADGPRKYTSHDLVISMTTTTVSAAKDSSVQTATWP